jgi:hypothetical protein
MDENNILVSCGWHKLLLLILMPVSCEWHKLLLLIGHAMRRLLSN